MPKRTLALIVGLIILTIVLLFAATKTTQEQKTQIAPTPTIATASPTPTPPAYTTLELSPNPASIGPTGSGKVDVLINTNQNTVSGVQIELSYDPKALRNIIVTPGTFFQKPLMFPEWNKIDQETGRVSHAQVLLPSQEPIKGKGIFATITFSRVVGSGLSQTELKFMPKTTVTQFGISPSVLKSSTGAIINLGAAQSVQAPQTTTAPMQQ
ncbi:MAG: Cohesin domain [Candidatus Parcubacteria bacterium]